MNYGSKKEIISAIMRLGAQHCAYSLTDKGWSVFCDCKYGYGEGGSDHGGEVNGCPELRTILALLENMPEWQFKLLTENAGDLSWKDVFDSSKKWHGALSAAIDAAQNAGYTYLEWRMGGSTTSA